MMGLCSLGARDHGFRHDKGCSTKYKVVFECGDNGMDCFVVSISMEINKMGVNIYIAS